MAEAVVEYDYNAAQDDELTLRVGDVIKNVVTADGGWWEGELKGKKGMFPDNFVKLKVKDAGAKKVEKREATQRKSVRELASKFKDGVPMPGSQPSLSQKKKGVKVSETPRMKKCKVMFDYKPENEDELELIVGQTIDFIREVEEGWWEGSLQGKSGVFPSNFVVMVDEGDVDQPADDSKMAAGDTDPNFQEIKGKKVVGVGLGNIFGGGPIKLRNTTKKGDPARPTKTEEKISRENKGATPGSSEQQSVERAIVRYSYLADQPDELNLKEGEVIRVLDKHLEDEGWWKGEAHGKVGVFPDNFVELLPSVDESSKFPKKPSQPGGKNVYPKLPEKASTSDDKNSGVRKDQARRKSGLTKRRLFEEEAAADKVADKVGTQKKPPAVPPVSKKPTLPPKTGEIFNKPPLIPPQPNRLELRGKDSSHNHHALPTNHSNHHAEDGNEASFDAVEASSHKLVHLTASRAKGPKKRPPSTVLFPAEADKPDGYEAGKGSNHISAEKTPPPTSKEHRHISASEAERGYRQHVSHTNNTGSSTYRDGHDSRHPHTATSRPPESARQHNSSPDASTLTRLVEDLQREVRDLRSHTVSKNDYNDLRSDYLRLKQDFEVFRNNHGKKLRELMLEVDEEKKLRLNTQVEMERVKRLLAETHL